MLRIIVIDNFDVQPYNQQLVEISAESPICCAPCKGPKRSEERKEKNNEKVYVSLLDCSTAAGHYGVRFRSRKHEDRKSTRLNSSHTDSSRMPSSA